MNYFGHCNYMSEKEVSIRFSAHNHWALDKELDEYDCAKNAQPAFKVDHTHNSFVF